MTDGDSLEWVVARETGEVDGLKNWVTVGRGRWKGGDIEDNERMEASLPQERAPSPFGTRRVRGTRRAEWRT